MSMPIPSATSGSSTSRCTTSAPHQRATPVTSIRRFFDGIRDQSTQPLSSLDYISLHLRDAACDRFEEGRLRLADRPFELAEQRVQALHRLDGIPDVDVGR